MPGASANSSRSKSLAQRHPARTLPRPRGHRGMAWPGLGNCGRSNRRQDRHQTSASSLYLSRGARGQVWLWLLSNRPRTNGGQRPGQRLLRGMAGTRIERGTRHASEEDQIAEQIALPEAPWLLYQPKHPLNAQSAHPAWGTLKTLGNEIKERPHRKGCSNIQPL